MPIKARRCLKTLVFAAVCAAFGTMLAAPQVVPALAAAPFCARGGGVRETWAMAFSFQPDNLITFLAPGFFGDDATGTYWGFFNFWEMCAYLGVVTLVAATAGVALGRRRVRWVLLVCACLTLLLAFGKHIGPLYRLYSALPGMGMLRGTSKFLSPFSLMVALLAGMGLDGWMGAGQRAARRAAIACGGLALLLAAGAFVLDARSALWEQWVRSVLVRGEHEGLLVGESALALARTNAWLALMRAAGILALAGGLWALVWFAARRRGTDRAGARKQRAGRLLAPALVVLFLIDLGSFGAEYLQKRHGFRVSHARMDGQTVAFLRAGSLGERGWVRHHRGLNDALRAGVHTLEGIEPNPPLFFHQLFAAGVRKPPDIAPSLYQITRASPLWDLMGVRQIAQPEAAGRPAHWRRDSPGLDGREAPVPPRGGAFYRNPRALRRAFVVHRYVLAPFDVRRAEGFPYREAVWLERAPATAPPPGEGRAPSGDEGRGAADILAESPNQIEIVAGLASPGWLVLTDNDFPGWRATANGRPVPIYRANYAFRAVPLGAGRHRVVFTYTPDGLGTGIVLFVLAVAGGLVQLAVWTARRRLRAVPLTPPRKGLE